MNHREVVQRFVEGGRQGTGHAIWTDGKDLFTKGIDVPGVIKLHDGSYLVSGSFNHAYLLPYNIDRVYCTGGEMADYCSRGRPASVILHSNLRPTTIVKSLDYLEQSAVKEYGYGARFPSKEIETAVMDRVLWWTVLRDRNATPDRRFAGIIRAMRRVSDSYFDKVFGEACAILRASVYPIEGEPDTQQFIETIFMTMILRNAPNKYVRRLSSALKTLLPGYRGVGRTDRFMMAVFLDPPFAVLSSLSQSLNDGWKLNLAVLISESSFICHTFDKNLADDLLHEEMINSL